MTFELFAIFWCGVHCCAHENEVYHFMYVFFSTLKALEIGFLHFYCVLSNTQEYSWVLLWSTQDLLEYIHKMSTQYSGADPEISKGGVHKITVFPLWPLFESLVVASLWNFVLHSGVQPCIKVYGDTHRMKQYLLFWFKIYFDCFNYKIISTIFFQDLRISCSLS